MDLIQTALRALFESEEKARAWEKEVKIFMPAIPWGYFQLAEGRAYTSESGYTNDADFFRDLDAAY